MNGDLEYQYKKARESSSTSLTISESEAIRDADDESSPSSAHNRAVHYDVSLPSPCRRRRNGSFAVPNPHCIITTKENELEHSCHRLSIIDDQNVQKTCMIDGGLCYRGHEMMAQKNGVKVTLSDIDDVKSPSIRRSRCDEGCLEMECRRDSLDLQKLNDHTRSSQSWISDEEPELRSLVPTSSPETTWSKSEISGNYEKDDADDPKNNGAREAEAVANGCGVNEEACLSSSTYFAFSDNGDKACRRDTSRMPTAFDGQIYTCGCCDVPLLFEKWLSDNEENVEETKSSADGRSSTDSTADWFDQQRVNAKNLLNDVSSTDLPAVHCQQDTPAPMVSNDNSTYFGLDEDANWLYVDDNFEADAAEGEEGQAANLDNEVSYQQLEHDEKLSHYKEPNVDVHCELSASSLPPSPIDDASSHCPDCISSCYDDSDGIPTFYVNYQRQTVVDNDDAPVLTGVQVCGPPGMELLFLIEQLAASACIVDDAAGPFMTLLQAAAPHAASGFYTDNSPRIVELNTEDEGDVVTGYVPSPAAAKDHKDHDDQQLREDGGEKSADDSTDINVQTSSSATDAFCDRSDVTIERRVEVIRKDRCRCSEREKGADGAEAPGVGHVRRSRIPVPRDIIGRPAANCAEIPTSKRIDESQREPAGRHHSRRRRLPSAHVAKSDHSDDSVDSGPSYHRRHHQLPQQQQQQVGGAIRDKYSLPDVFVDRRKPPLPPAAKRPDPSHGRGLRLPPVHAPTQRIRDPPRFFPPPPQRRRSHPLAPRRPMTPPNRNVLASRAVGPSMASGRVVEDEWTRRAAAMRRRTRLPPIHPTASVVPWD